MAHAGQKSRTIHATCIRLACGKRSLGLALIGPSGSGKSCLALRMLDTPGHGAGSQEPITAQLVSDDQVVLTRDGDVLMASAPANLAGLLEVRGLGIVRIDAPAGPLALDCIVEHAAADDGAPAAERLPELSTTRMLGVDVLHYRMDLLCPGAPARLRTVAQAAWSMISTV